ncbi:unnamed protein product [Rotaria socialis]|uniref:Peptidase C1A papain C-terminal domain-containing protein n=3 Tax=Rotaria socialis TaxID=392032 RepID=A0A818HPF8_9BILA|nr:unnamed protein product [Rotaria socialis]
MAEAETKFLVNPETGDRFPIGGCFISDEPSPWPLCGSVLTLSDNELPQSVDLRQFMTPVENQGQTNTCVANALAGAYEFLIMKNTKKHIDVSRLYMYYNGRTIDNLHTQKMADNGTFIWAAIAGLKRHGCCKEGQYPFNPSSMNTQPPPECYTEGAKHRIKDAFQVPVTLNSMKGCLAEGFPFAFGLGTFLSFAQAQTNGGRVPTPNPMYEPLNAQHGQHAMLAVGYSDASKCFIVRNSWGDTWGDKGYCYIAYEYMTNPQLCHDLHCIRLVEDTQDRRRTTNIVNPYDWNVDKNKKYYIPSDYTFPDFDFTFFWKVNDHFNYFKNISTDGEMVPFIWAQSNVDSDKHRSHKRETTRDEERAVFVLWIDKKSTENTHVMEKFTSGTNITVDFRETYSSAEAHLSKIKDRIQSSSNFLIICRGFYKYENKNPLNLLRFLNDNGLDYVPVIVFTQDKDGLLHHFKSQASSIGVRDWEHRLFITSSSEELITKIKEKIHHKHGR